MRHIPEDELHAYLDQGLSRSQCVEIESHLAACPSCQAARDGIAALGTGPRRFCPSSPPLVPFPPNSSRSAAVPLARFPPAGGERI